MSSILDKIRTGGDPLPPRTVLAGPEGIGKSTWGASSPSPVFIAPEDGLEGLDHIKRLPADNMEDVTALLDALEKDPGDYKTIVIDTADWLERTIQRYLCERDNKQDIEAYGFGKGYKLVETELIKLLAQLDRIRHAHKVGVVLLSHVHIKKFKDPSGDEWDRFEMKGNKIFTGILREWPDACLFARYEVFKVGGNVPGKERTIGGDRVIHTQWSPAWDAKNRYSLPETLPMPEEGGYGVFADSIQENSPTRLRERFLKLVQETDIPADQKDKFDKAARSVGELPVEKLRAGVKALEAMVA